MISKTLSTLGIQEVLLVLKQRQDFFSLSVGARKEAMTTLIHSLPMVSEYMSSISEDAFTHDLTGTISGLNGTRYIENPLLTALIKDVQSLLLNDDLHTTGRVESLAKQLTAHLSDRECRDEYLGWIRSLGLVLPLIHVESSHLLPPAIKQEIEQYVHGHIHPLALPVYRTNRTLLGGIRLFLDGKLYDFSLKGRLDYTLQSLYSLAS